MHTFVVPARAGVLLLGAALAIGFCSGVGAQGFPNRPLKLIVPYPPGGVGDTFGRVYGQALAERLGQPVLIDNKPGAAQAIGAEAAQLVENYQTNDKHMPLARLSCFWK